VKANKGSAGIDDQSIRDFERNLKDNLYKIWNRMSSGCYFPPAVKAVTIPKGNGGKRVLGIPTVADRVAQMVVKLYIESKLERCFHHDSYGYRPGKSAHQALAVTRRRCWDYDWVIDLDIKGFFDNMNHGLTMKALRHHVSEKWILLYVERWLKAPTINEEGQKIERHKGTPQGGVISPILANLFMHYAFDAWMTRQCPHNPFARKCTKD
jgi:RNA-directed DNA polymerase